MLGLAVNGTGVVADFDPKNAFSFKIGVQQSNPDATNLSDSIYSLAEVGYTVTPFSLPEGHYRAVVPRQQRRCRLEARGRRQPRSEADVRSSTVFGRYGQQQTSRRRDRLLERRPLVRERHGVQPARHVGHRLRADATSRRATRSS